MDRATGGDALSKLLAWTGATVGGALGWWLGSRAGVLSAFLLSVVGTGAGMYLGRWVAERLLHWDSHGTRDIDNQHRRESE